ncbi:MULTISPECIES: ABC transporter permease [Pediococcus]|uniref:ABC transporter permease n=1 Tax=Pediococcus parvulus TaxID=54062 RepID=A0AAP5TCX9_9LACO|nr:MULTISPECIES: ABC transporter permease [Pediococcus]MCT3028997.1 ABC transporter permease [Pediococcus parvulus]MCT3030686.1 ABC transporter permease [Pediococcus parvulus]MCT3033959.1 ABC transporter permease [Pediococcus parvulus]MDN5574422.1 ABC transporter permease [Pediococcus sp.]MDV7694756.1 ABC transporter permease [Pediococcus parvulus]
MNARLIFKMELFKYLRDKYYLMATLILFGLNVIATIALLNFDHLNSSLLVTSIVLAILLFVSNLIFLGIIYPFHLLAIDYKNRVLALMVASGVNRNKLFFAKIGAVILANIVVSFVLLVVPVATLIYQVGNLGGWDELFGEMGMLMVPQMIPLSINAILSYIAGLFILMTSVIIVKGKTLSILLYFGFNMLVGVITSFINTLFTSNSSFTQQFSGDTVASSVIEVIVILVFGFIALQGLRHQNL